MIYFSYFSMLLTIAAVYYVGKPKLRGQYLMLVAHICWMIYSIRQEQGAMFCQSLILFLVTIKAVNNWTIKDIEL